jgi:hypothetical protein
VNAVDVDWSRLSDAYGDARGVPRALDRLAAADPGARRDAIDELWGRLCHQETVYSASAAAVPGLVAAVESGRLTPLDRHLVLGLIVYIGRGDDTCWEGYTERADVEACRQAVAAVTPQLVRRAVGGDDSDQAAALQLGLYHPQEFHSAAVDPHELLAAGAEASVAAGAALARALIAGEEVTAARVRAAAAADEDTLDYLQESLADEPVAQQARRVALELLDRT